MVAREKRAREKAERRWTEIERKGNRESDEKEKEKTERFWRL